LQAGFRRTPNPGRSDIFILPLTDTGSLRRSGANIGTTWSAFGAIIRNSANGLFYRAADAVAAAAALAEFADGPWGRKYPAITAAWRRNWEQVIPFLAYPPEMRRMIYTTNAIESLNSTLRPSVRTRGHFPSDEAATKLIWLQLREVTKNWKMPAREWHMAKAQFALLFGDRFELNH
jgi:transposase-like protein